MSKIAKFQLHLEAAFGENFWSFFCILKVPLSIIILINVILYPRIPCVVLSYVPRRWENVFNVPRLKCVRNVNWNIIELLHLPVSVLDSNIFIINDIRLPKKTDTWIINGYYLSRKTINSNFYEIFVGGIQTKVDDDIDFV